MIIWWRQMEGVYHNLDVRYKIRELVHRKFFSYSQPKGTSWFLYSYLDQISVKEGFDCFLWVHNFSVDELFHSRVLDCCCWFESEGPLPLKRFSSSNNRITNVGFSQFKAPEKEKKNLYLFNDYWVYFCHSDVLYHYISEQDESPVICEHLNLHLKMCPCWCSKCTEL